MKHAGTFRKSHFNDIGPIMAAISLKSGSLARLLGNWRGDNHTDPAYRLLARALRLLIVDGRVSPGARLPGERELARTLEISRTTLSAAYAELRDEGYLESHRGSGSFAHLPQRQATEPESQVNDLGETFVEWTAAALPAPPGLWRAYEEALGRLPAFLSGIGYDAQGLSCMREAIARDYEQRGCPTSPEQIMVTSGAQSGFSLILRALARPGDRVVVDNPTYHNALGAIRRNSCQPVPVSLPATGWDLEALDAAVRQTGPCFAYLQPDFHNPTGQLMNAAERKALVQIAARTLTPLVIDETMVGTGFEAFMPLPVAAYDPENRVVITLGSMSKRYWGGLRIGWIRASEQRIAELVRLRSVLDMATPVMEQLTATVMLERANGDGERRASLRASQEKLIALLADALPDWRVHSPQGGLALWVEMPRPNASVLAALAQGLGLRFVPGPRFAVDGGFERFVRLPFTLSEPDLRCAVDRLALANARLSRRFHIQSRVVDALGADYVI